MKKINFETPGGSKITVEGNGPYYRMICNFHATANRSFMEKLEKNFFIRSIVFRDEQSFIAFSLGHESFGKPVAEVVRKTVEETLP